MKGKNLLNYDEKNDILYIVSKKGKVWRRGRDSNPGYSCEYTCSPGTRAKPDYATSPKDTKLL